jgi:predicted nuclease of predicted toxin-antitoxin system
MGPRLVPLPVLMCFYLDENLSQDVAAIAKEYGIDVTCSHDCGLDGSSDEEQLAYAAAERRVMVTRNYRDYSELTKRFQEEGRPHAGVLFVPSSLPNHHVQRIALALVRYANEHPQGMAPYAIDYLKPP